MTVHHLAATPETCRFGMIDGKFPPVLAIQSGDTVVVTTVSGGPESMPPPDSGLVVPPALKAIHEASLPRMGPHIVTGPIAVADADVGDILEIRIDDISFGADWGYNIVRPLLGTLHKQFPVWDITHIPIDAEARTCRLPWNAEIPLSPFFGIIGVSPPAHYGTLSTREPRAFGGNIDNKELIAGSTLYLPVMVPGANFFVGDGHGVQGDGEVCLTALEICLTGTFTLILHKSQQGQPPLAYPQAESSTHFISFGLADDLDQAMEKALEEMIDFIVLRTGWTRMQAYKTCSLAVDFRVTQTVNGEKGVHGMLRKGLLF